MNWLRTVVLLCSSLAAACGELTPATDAALSDGAPIIGGSAFTGLPGVGALLYHGGEYCTGTLASPRTVVTAAHCLRLVQPSDISFALGPDVSKPVAEIAVRAFVMHPGYSHATHLNDVGVVTLAGDAPGEPLGMLAKMDQGFVGKELLFVGYGIDNALSISGQGTKRAARIPIAGIDDHTFRFETHGQSTCSGDSGGPAIYEDSTLGPLVAGITSYGDITCSEYGVDTRVDTVLDFIEANLVPGGGPTDECQGETTLGRCANTTLVRCVSGVGVERDDCAAQSQVCISSSDGKPAYCGDRPPAPPAPPQDPCQGETHGGRCYADTAIWCENHVIQRMDCADQGSWCDWSPTLNRYGCM